MKKLVLASLLATSASAAVHTANTNSAAAAAAAATPPYTFLLRFPDGSVEVCPATGFAIGFPEINVDVVSCVSDKVFGGTFDS